MCCLACGIKLPCMISMLAYARTWVAVMEKHYGICLTVSLLPTYYPPEKGMYFMYINLPNLINNINIKHNIINHAYN